MSKLPYIPFYTGDWLKDPALSICTPAARGVWMDLLCAMHEAGRLGELRGTTDQLARVARCSTAELVQALTDLQTTEAAIVQERNGIYQVTNRRMKREAEIREQAAARQRINRSRHRSVTPAESGCNDSGRKDLDPALNNCHGTVTGLSHDSSMSVSISNKPPSPPLTQTKTGDGGGIFESWDQIAVRLSNLNISAVTGAIKNAKQHGLTPVHVNELIDHWERHRGSWNEGGLKWRISEGSPVQNPTEGWPPVNREFAAAEKKKKTNQSPSNKADQIIRIGRRERKPDSVIESELKAAGLEWPK